MVNSLGFVTRVEALLKLVFTDWWDAVYWFWLILIVGIYRIGKRVFLSGGKLMVVKLLALRLKYC